MRKFILAFVLLILIMPATLVSAQSDYGEEYDDMLSESGADELFSTLPDGTREYLNDAGIYSVDADALKNMSISDVLNILFKGALSNIKSPLRLFLICTGVILLTSLLNGFEETIKNSSQKNIFSVVSVLCLSTAIMTPVIKIITDTVDTVKQAGDFLISFIPVYAGIVAVSGKPVSAFTYYSSLMGATELMTLVATGFLVPLISVYLALCLSGAVNDTVNISSVAKGIKKFMMWTMGFCMSVFVGLLTVKSFVSSSADSLTAKTGKFLISSFVPIVGSALSDALGVVNGSLGLIKSAVGGFGILAVLLTFLPSVISIGLMKLSLSAAQCVSEVLDVKKTSALLESTAFVMSILMSFVICFGIMIIISVALIMAVGSSV